jgi:hypothetical protein
LDYRSIEISDKDIITEILSKTNFRACELCFTNLFAWQKTLCTKICIEDNTLFIRMKINNMYVHLFPFGATDIKDALNKIKSCAEENEYIMKLSGITKDMMPILDEAMPFKYQYNRDYADYIYNSEDLINLSGKKYHGKRNHIARFKEHGVWVFEDISKDNFKECCDMNAQWCRLNDCSNDEGLKNEMCAVKEALNHFDELGLEGGLLRLDGKVVAYTIGEPLTKDTYVVHIEKAFSEIQGAYPMINREFAARRAKEYKFINREEDMGIESLRKAKESYQPAFLLEKHMATVI